MAKNVIMPKLGMTMKQGKVTKWYCEEGDRVEKGAVIADIETDKISYQIEAPVSGILAKILIGEGGVAAVGEVIQHVQKGVPNNTDFLDRLKQLK